MAAQKGSGEEAEPWPRWQQELLWKLWKQYGGIDSWRSEKAVRIETEVYAKLIGLLVAHWITLLGCWPDPHRSLGKALHMGQWVASAIGFALIGEMPMERVLLRVTGAMRAGCRINPRRKKPTTAQLLEHPSLIRGLG